ncbi:hypothetical protein F5Y02DRAFT_275755 [Annulohypoxylon stygium]|nr:hypothetical protein F5Y02DRAFT_275755 [Annulohypoxylon stygium]
MHRNSQPSAEHFQHYPSLIFPLAEHLLSFNHDQLPSFFLPKLSKPVTLALLILKQCFALLLLDSRYLIPIDMMRPRRRSVYRTRTFSNPVLAKVIQIIVSVYSLLLDLNPFVVFHLPARAWKR